jgi:hypothetical protein
MIVSVAKGYQSRGFQLYQRVANGALGETGEAYRCFLCSVFDTFAADLQALFDCHALRAACSRAKRPCWPCWRSSTRPTWSRSGARTRRSPGSTNSGEERQAMRKASQAPRNSRELAVRDQFFTPRYVVEFLVDNTLGRLWFNWTGGRTSLRDRCTYLLVKPDEQPEPTARLRDPRTIKLLDPACGSMQFRLSTPSICSWKSTARRGPGRPSMGHGHWTRQRNQRRG